MTHFMPDPDEADEDFFGESRETVYRKILCGLREFYAQAEKPTSIQEAAAWLRSTKSLEMALHSELLLQALRVLIREEFLSQMDRVTFCATRNLPARTIDDDFQTYYQYAPETQRSDGLPTRKEVIDTVAAVVPEFKGQLFTMEQLAKAWKKKQTKTLLAQLPAIFDIKSGIGLFMYVVGCLVKRHVIEFASENNGFGSAEGYREVRKKIEENEIRCLDDEWNC